MAVAGVPPWNVHFQLVGVFDEASEKYFNDAGEIYLGRIDYDQRVEEYNLKGEALRKIPDDSPACRSIRKILEKAGLI